MYIIPEMKIHFIFISGNDNNKSPKLFTQYTLSGIDLHQSVGKLSVCEEFADSRLLFTTWNFQIIIIMLTVTKLKCKHLILHVSYFHFSWKVHFLFDIALCQAIYSLLQLSHPKKRRVEISYLLWRVWDTEIVNRTNHIIMWSKTKKENQKENKYTWLKSITSFNN